MSFKLTNIFDSGRLRAANTVAGIALAEVLQRSEGLVVPPGDAAALAETIGRLAADGELRLAMGRRARSYAEQHLDRQVILKKFWHRLSQPATLGAVQL